MLLHRCENAEITLYAFRVVVIIVIVNHTYEAFTFVKLFAVVPLSFQNASKAFHWTVVNTMCHSRHTLCHPSLLQLSVKASVRILKSAVTVE